MRKILWLFAALTLIGCTTVPEVEDTPLGAPWQMPGRQVSIRDNNFTVLSQISDTSYAPTNSLQAYMEWMDDNWVGFNTNASYYYADGTTQNMWRVIIRDYLTANNSALIATNLTVGGTLYAGDVVVSNDLDVMGSATISNALDVGGALTADSIETDELTLSGTFLNSSNDMAESFMGFPKVALTNSMLTVYINSGTPITTNSMNNAFDLDTTTVTSEGVASDAEIHHYMLDLGEEYNGYVMLRLSTTSDSSSAFIYGSMSTVEEPAFAGNVLYPHMINESYSLGSGADDGTREFWDTRPVSGRYIYWAARSTGGGVSLDYTVKDWSVYAITNAYRNMGGF